MSDNEFKNRISKYSLSELRECLSGLDVDKYPDRLALLQQAIRDFKPGNPETAAACQNSAGSEYAGFWVRVGAYLVDILMMAPYLALSLYLSNQFLYYYIYAFIPGILFAIFYYVYLVERFGGTPGKLALKIRIKMLDGSDVTRKAAVLRYLPLFVLSTLSSLAFVMGSSLIREETYYSLSYSDKNRLIMELAPKWYSAVNTLMQIWILAEFVTLLFNKSRRSVHDFIAGTIVVKATSLKREIQQI